METSPDLPVRPARHRKGRTWRHLSKSSLDEDLNGKKLVEESERKMSPKKVPSRRGSSSCNETNSPGSCKSVGDVSSPNKSLLKENGMISMERNSPQSPKLGEVTLREIPDSRSPSKSTNRSSAGVRLFRVSEEKIVSFSDKEIELLTSGLLSC